VICHVVKGPFCSTKADENTGEELQCGLRLVGEAEEDEGAQQGGSHWRQRRCRQRRWIVGPDEWTKMIGKLGANRTTDKKDKCT